MIKYFRRNRRRDVSKIYTYRGPTPFCVSCKRRLDKVDCWRDAFECATTMKYRETTDSSFQITRYFFWGLTNITTTVSFETPFVCDDNSARELYFMYLYENMNSQFGTAFNFLASCYQKVEDPKHTSAIHY